MRSDARANRQDLLEAAEALLNVHGPTAVSYTHLTLPTILRV